MLHDASFIDDPTRLLRLARYRARLRFEIEPHTAELARQALAAGALTTVSGARIGAELRLALTEADAPAALAAMDDLGLLAALELRTRDASRRDRWPAIERALALLPDDGRPDLLALAGAAAGAGRSSVARRPRSPRQDHGIAGSLRVSRGLTAIAQLPRRSRRRV